MRKWYAAYVGRFSADGSLHPRLKLKLEHGARVAEEARDVARELRWSEDDVRTAGVLGLFHDVGRFSQFAEFGTFNDRKSVDHGGRGCEILLDERPLGECGARDRRRILDGVRYHNAGSVPGALEDDSLRFVRLVRDADKLDLYGVAYDEMVAGDCLGGLDPDAAPSREVLECLRRRRAVPNELVKSLADLLLWQVGWVYDVNYPPTMRRFRERRVLEEIRGRLPERLEVAEVLALAFEFRDGAPAG